MDSNITFMRSIISILVFLSAIIISAETYAQVKCYRFSLVLQGTDWRDTSCVACTSDPDVIADVNNQLSKQFADRNKHINGAIAAGNASVNKNAHYNFLWHFKVNEWSLRELSMEVCDGRPYSDVDLDTAYWLNTIGFFCPWTSIVAEEIAAAHLRDVEGNHINVTLYPNPAGDHISLVSATKLDGRLEIYDLTGNRVHSIQIHLPAGATFTSDISHLPGGLYIVRMTDGPNTIQQKLSITR